MGMVNISHLAQSIGYLVEEGDLVLSALTGRFSRIAEMKTRSRSLFASALKSSAQSTVNVDQISASADEYSPI
jgi:hypothetical protein